MEQLGVKPLLLDTPEKFVAAWEASGADNVRGNFHPDQTGAFAQWARNQGYDSIVIPDTAFFGDLGYTEVSSRIGEPQTIVLYPPLCRIIYIKCFKFF